MTAPFNRRRLARILQLPEDASDARIAAALRREARKFRRRGRPFVLPRDLDLDGCLAVLDRRLAEEEAYLDKIWDAFFAAECRARERRDKADRRACLCILGLQLLLQARDRPD